MGARMKLKAQMGKLSKYLQNNLHQVLEARVEKYLRRRFGITTEPIKRRLTRKGSKYSREIDLMTHNCRNERRRWLTVKLPHNWLRTRNWDTHGSGTFQIISATILNIWDTVNYSKAGLKKRKEEDKTKTKNSQFYIDGAVNGSWTQCLVAFWSSKSFTLPPLAFDSWAGVELSERSRANEISSSCTQMGNWWR